MKSILCILCAVVLLSSCKKDAKQPALVTNDIAGIKSADWRNNIGKEFEVEGILIDEGNGHPLLYSNEQDYLINGLTPETRYINLNVSGSDYTDLKEFFGYKVKFTGVLEVTTDESVIKVSRMLGDISQARLKVKPGIKKTSATQYIKDPFAVDHCAKYPWTCVGYSFGPIIHNKYALLYSGGCSSSEAAIRFWNDIGATYKMLMAKGFSPDNIIVVYKDGKPDKGYASYNNVPVNYAATAAGFQAAIDQLKNRMTVRDTFVLAISNHGGGNNTHNANAGNSGAIDSDNDDKHGAVNDMTDEIICYYNESKSCTDDDLRNYINQLRFGCMIGLLGPCYSGGLIYDLRGPNRVLISAATEFQYSWGYSDIDIFFATLLNSIAFEGVIPDPFDLNHDGKRTLNETFVGMVYGTQQNKIDQQPQYSDDGTGEYSATPSASGYGSTIIW
jgi:uncharacterized lipoprotein YajG